MIDDILAVVRARSGIDFSGYRAQTVQRRIHNRMAAMGAASLAEYVRLLDASEGEVTRLVEGMTIKVSRFYRNAAAFDILRDGVLPRLAAPGRPLRLWSAGCGRGEEAYTLAMLLEAAGLEGSVEATDIDGAALVRAREATYAAETVDELPAALRERYLEAGERDGRVVVRPCRAVRARVRFSRHDLASAKRRFPGPFELVCCRNVLIYWDRASQAGILSTLVSALAESGVLFMGEAEWPHGPAAARLRPLAETHRLFERGLPDAGEAQ